MKGRTRVFRGRDSIRSTNLSHDVVSSQLALDPLAPNDLSLRPPLPPLSRARFHRVSSVCICLPTTLITDGRGRNFKRRLLCHSNASYCFWPSCFPFESRFRSTCADLISPRLATKSIGVFSRNVSAGKLVSSAVIRRSNAGTLRSLGNMRYKRNSLLR